MYLLAWSIHIVLLLPLHPISLSVHVFVSVKTPAFSREAVHPYSALTAAAPNLAHDVSGMDAQGRLASVAIPFVAVVCVHYLAPIVVGQPMDVFPKRKGHSLSFGLLLPQFPQQ
jgi:hypothetical protein